MFLVSISLFLLVSSVLVQVKSEDMNTKECTDPEGVNGDYLTEGCYRHTCHNGVWRLSHEETVCCYEGQPFTPNSTMFSQTSQDGCVTSYIECTMDQKQPKPVLQVENKCAQLPRRTEKDIIEVMANTVNEILEDVVSRTETAEEKLEEMEHLLEFQMYKLENRIPCDIEITAEDTEAWLTATQDTPTEDSNTAATNIKEGSQVLLISGGKVDRRTVEVFDPITGESCRIQHLPSYRSGHLMHGLYVCGGNYRDCLHYSSNMWTQVYKKNYTAGSNWFQPGWATDEGLVQLRGGFDTIHTEGDDWQNVSVSSFIFPTAEAGGDVRPTFSLKFDSEYACAIPDLTSQSVILTGGYDRYVKSYRGQVTRYNMNGWLEELPMLKEPRKRHGCGAYINGENTQVLLVAGGRGEGYYNDLSSTELLPANSPEWTTTTPLPVAVYGLVGITMENKFYMTGGYSDFEGGQKSVLKWDDETQAWESVGNMSSSRYYHAITTTQFEGEVYKYCG